MKTHFANMRSKVFFTYRIVNAIYQKQSGKADFEKSAFMMPFLTGNARWEIIAEPVKLCAKEDKMKENSFHIAPGAESQEIFPGIVIIGNTKLPGYLIMAAEPVMIDAGISVVGPKYIEGLRKYLGNPSHLKKLILTHAHFDHCGAAPYLKRKIPELKIYASSISAGILKRPNAIKLIRSLNEDLEKMFGVYEDVSFTNLDVDIKLKEGDEIDPGNGFRMLAIQAPGHTKDTTAYYMPEKKILFAAEAAGALDLKGDLYPTFLSDYEQYVASIRKLMGFEVEAYILGHGVVIKGEEASDFLQRAIEAAEKYRERIERYLKEENGNQEVVAARIIREDYDEKKIIDQPRRSYSINVAARVRTIARLTE